MTLQSETLSPPKTGRVSTIEFWRFIFTAMVCIYHLEIFFRQRELLVSGTSAVEFFFVLAGFLIAMSAKRDLDGGSGPVTTKQAHAMALDFVRKKLKAIYPILIVVVLLGFLVYPAAPSTFTQRLLALQNTEWEWLLLVGTPFGFNAAAAPIIPMWFLTALIAAGYIYTFALYKHYDFMMFAAPAIGVLFYVYFALNATVAFDHDIAMGFLNAGMVRAVAQMALGVSVFSLYDYLSKKKLNLAWRTVLSLLEIYSIYRFFALTLWQPVGMDNYRRLVYILIIVLLSFLNQTLLSRVLNRRFWRKLGGITLAMYLCHYNLIMVYFKLLGAVKMKLMALSLHSPAAKALQAFLQDTGGFDSKFKAVPMSWKDMLLFSLMVIILSVLIVLCVGAVRRFIIRPCKVRYLARQAEKETAAAVD